MEVLGVNCSLVNGATAVYFPQTTLDFYLQTEGE